MAKSEVEKLARSINEERERDSGGCVGAIILVGVAAWFITAYWPIILGVGGCAFVVWLVVGFANGSKEERQRLQQASFDKWIRGMSAQTVQVGNGLRQGRAFALAQDIQVKCGNGHHYSLADFDTDPRGAVSCPTCRTSIYSIVSPHTAFVECKHIVQSRRFGSDIPFAIDPSKPTTTSHWYDPVQFGRCPICYWETDCPDVVPMDLRWNATREAKSTNVPTRPYYSASPDPTQAANPSNRSRWQQRQVSARSRRDLDRQG